MAGTTPTLQETLPAFTVGYVLLTSILGTILMRNADSFDQIIGGLSSVSRSR